MQPSLLPLVLSAWTEAGTILRPPFVKWAGALCSVFGRYSAIVSGTVLLEVSFRRKAHYGSKVASFEYIAAEFFPRDSFL